jgi:hypothetical protein
MVVAVNGSGTMVAGGQESLFLDACLHDNRLARRTGSKAWCTRSRERQNGLISLNMVIILGSDRMAGASVKVSRTSFRQVSSPWRMF